MKRGPLEVVKVKTATIPIYSDLHHGKQTFLIAYYADGQRKRERFHTFDEARKQAKAKAHELSTGAAHVGNFTPEQTATIKGAIEILRVAGCKLLPAVSEYVEARKILGGEAGIVDAARHYVRHLEEQKKKAELVPITLPALVEKFMEDVRERKKSRRYTLDMQARLARAALGAHQEQLPFGASNALRVRQEQGSSSPRTPDRGGILHAL
jgi:hypothetical protein